MVKIKEVQGHKEQFFKFICPGCNCEHIFDKRWKFNQNFDNPTMTPSFLQKGFLGFYNEEPIYGTCHSFIKEGKIQFLNDCTHGLKGQTVNLLDF